MRSCINPNVIIHRPRKSTCRRVSRDLSRASNNAYAIAGFSTRRFVAAIAPEPSIDEHSSADGQTIFVSSLGLVVNMTNRGVLWCMFRIIYFVPMSSLRAVTAEPLRRIRRMLEDEGMRGLANRLYSHHRSVYFEMPLDKEIGQPQTDLDVHPDFNRTDEVVAWIKAQPVPGTWSPTELARIEERQQLIGGLYRGQELVGYTKLGWSTVYIMDYQCDLTLPERDCMVLDSYIAPKVRGRGLGSVLVTESSREMQRRGFARRLSFVKADNAAMFRVAEKVGYRRLGQVDFYIILRRRYFRPDPLVLIEARDTSGT